MVELKIGEGKKGLREGILSDSYALDTSVIIEMLNSSAQGRIVLKALIDETANAYTSDVNLAEAEYVLCRNIGKDESKLRIDNLRQSNYIAVADSEEVSRLAARIKCERAISFADCYCIATANVTGSKPLFAFREKELEREVKRSEGKFEILFLDDLLKPDFGK